MGTDPVRRGRRALQTLNFFMADMQAGVGPFLGVFLLAHGWQSGWIGSVMTLGGVAFALGSLALWTTSARLMKATSDTPAAI